MPKKKLKAKFSTKLYHIFMIVFLCSVFMYISTSYNKYSMLKQKEDKLLLDIKEKEQQNVVLNGKLELYQTDAYIEEIARDKLGYIKSNEIVYINRTK